MKAYRLKVDVAVNDATTFCAGSIVLIEDDGLIHATSEVMEEVPDGTPISIPASRTEPV